MKYHTLTCVFAILIGQLLGANKILKKHLAIIFTIAIIFLLFQWQFEVTSTLVWRPIAALSFLLLVYFIPDKIILPFEAILKYCAYISFPFYLIHYSFYRIVEDWQLDWVLKMFTLFFLTAICSILLRFVFFQWPYKWKIYIIKRFAEKD